MQKYFDLLLELLWPEDDELILDEKKKFSATAKKIEERGDKNLKISHKVGFIFEAYEELLNDGISLDEFLATGDITNEDKLNMNGESSIDVLSGMINGNLDVHDNTLFILDSVSFAVLSGSDKKIIQNWAKNHNCELVFC